MAATQSSQQTRNRRAHECLFDDICIGGLRCDAETPGHSGQGCDRPPGSIQPSNVPSKRRRRKCKKRGNKKGSMSQSLKTEQIAEDKTDRPSLEIAAKESAHCSLHTRAGFTESSTTSLKDVRISQEVVQHHVSSDAAEEINSTETGIQSVMTSDSPSEPEDEVDGGAGLDLSPRLTTKAACSFRTPSYSRQSGTSLTSSGPRPESTSPEPLPPVLVLPRNPEACKGVGQTARHWKYSKAMDKTTKNDSFNKREEFHKRTYLVPEPTPPANLYKRRQSESHDDKKDSEMDCWSSAAQYPELSSAECRYKTFGGTVWALEAPTVDDLVSAGLFYKGPGDKTQCFMCGVVLLSWKASDDTTTQHGQYSPSCLYLQVIAWKPTPQKPLTSVIEQRLRRFGFTRNEISEALRNVTDDSKLTVEYVMNRIFEQEDEVYLKTIAKLLYSDMESLPDKSRTRIRPKSARRTFNSKPDPSGNDRTSIPDGSLHLGLPLPAFHLLQNSPFHRKDNNLVSENGDDRLKLGAQGPGNMTVSSNSGSKLPDAAPKMALPTRDLDRNTTSASQRTSVEPSHPAAVMNSSEESPVVSRPGGTRVTPGDAEITGSVYDEENQLPVYNNTTSEVSPNSRHASSSQDLTPEIEDQAQAVSNPLLVPLQPICTRYEVGRTASSDSGLGPKEVDIIGEETNKTLTTRQRHRQMLSSCGDSECDSDTDTVDGQWEKDEADTGHIERERQRLTEENESLRMEFRCKICLERDATKMFLSCGHLACCHACAGQLTLCPICRNKISATMTVYMAS